MTGVAKYDAVATRPDPIPPPPDEVHVYLEATANPPTKATVVSEGPQGPPGPAGPAGAGGTVLEYTFPLASTLWSLPHPFNLLYVDVSTFDINDEEVFGDVEHVNPNLVEVRFFYPTSGKATVRV